MTTSTPSVIHLLARHVLLLMPAIWAASQPGLCNADVRKVYDCQYTAQPPAIDGELSDACWQQAGWAGIRLNTEEAKQAGTSRADARLLWDDVYLYFAARVVDATPRADHRERDDRVWEDDCFEIYVNPSGDGATYFELDINSHGAIWDSMGLPHHRGRLQLIRAWTAPSLEVRTVVGDGGWTVEGRIRFSDLVGADRVPPHHGDRWPMNLFYIDAQPGRGEQTLLAWNPTEQFNDVARFGEIRFVNHVGEAQLRRDRAMAERLLGGNLLANATSPFATAGDMRVWSERAGDYRRRDDGSGWRPARGFGRATVIAEDDVPRGAMRLQPNAGDDPTHMQWTSTTDGLLVLLARLHPSAAASIHEAGGDGVWLTLDGGGERAGVRLRDAEWCAVSLNVIKGRTIRLTVDAGPAHSYVYDHAQVAAYMLPADALAAKLPGDWKAFGAAGMVIGLHDAAGAQSEHADVIHVRATDHFTGAKRAMPAVPGARLYRVTGMIRTELLGDTKAHVGIDYLDAEGKFVRQATTRAALDGHLRWGLHNVSGASPWARFVAHAYDPPPDVASLSIWLGVNAWETPDAEGEAWFADIQVQAVAPDERYPLGFAPLMWTGDAPAARPSAADFTLCVTPTTRYQLPQMPPARGVDDEALEVHAWPSAAAAASFTIHPSRDLQQVDVAVSDLTLRGTPAAVIPAAAVEVRQVRTLYRKRHMMSSDYLLSPNHLEPLKPLSLTAGMNQQVWLTVRVPSGAGAGRYEGIIRVRSADAAEKRMSLVVHVTPIAPAKPRDVFLGVYSYYLPQDTPAVLRGAFQDMRDHGMNTTFLFNGNLRIPITTEAGRAVIQWEQPNQLREVMEIYGEAGFSEPLLLLAPQAFYDAAKQVSGDDGSHGPAFAAAYRDLFVQMRDEGRARQWPAFIIAPYDEGYPYPFADIRFDLTRGMIPPLRDAGLLVAVHSLNHALGRAWRFEAEFQPVIDVILQTFNHAPGCGPLSPGGGYRGYRSWEQYRDALVSEGRRVLFYNPDVTGIHPEALRFAYGVGLWKLGASGMINWHYHEPKRDGTYALSRRQGGDVLNLIFPPYENWAGGPSIGWEATRQGVMDYQLLQTLDGLVRQATSSNDPARAALAAQAQREVDAVLSRVRFDTIDSVGALAIPNRWERETVDDQGIQRIFGEYKLPNGLELADYDRLRRLLIDRIAELSAP